MIFRVQVDCWYTAKPKPICERRVILVEADRASVARARAEKYAEETAACSHHLSVVEWRSTVSMDFPRDVIGGAQFRQQTTFRNLPEPKRRKQFPKCGGGEL